ncbi:MAG: DUF1592 domain-containing protein, partial [Pseudomonadales bacterium]|nr:DUF1592 domain-containing protein [Pseudomonadales bacterium]
MKWTSNAAVLCGVLAIRSVFLVQAAAQAAPLEAEQEQAKPAETELDPTALEDQATQVFGRYCGSCHGPDKQEGKVRLDALETIDPVDRQELFASVQQRVQLGEMPPEKAKQPSDAERKILMQWLDSQLTGEAAQALAEKLLRFEYGNVVDHEDLFSGKYADLPGYTTDRRWLISEFIFNEKVNRLLDYHPTRAIYGVGRQVAGDSGVHWSPKTERGDSFRRTITNPFLLPKVVGVRYSGHDAITAGHLLTMLGNAKRIAGHMSSEATMKAHYPAMFALMKTDLEHREVLRSREQFLSTYTYMDHLLKDLYGDEHKTLLPKLVRADVAAPEPLIDRDGGLKARESNLGLLGRLDPVDRLAVYRSIAAYDSGGLTVVEVAPEDGGRYQTYSTPTLEDYNQIIRKAEREWFTEGVSDYRIENRITTLRLFYIQWDLAGIYKMIKGGDFGTPQFVPLDDAEMAVIVETIKKNRAPGDTYLQIIEKCMADWQASFKAEREAASDGSDEKLGALIVELYQKVYEREPSPLELKKNIALMNSYLSQLEMQQAIAKLIESLVLDTEFAYRNEFGTGEADAFGRRMMSPRDASYALAYAITDSSPDAELVKAVDEDRLNTRADYEREVRRMLKRRDVWTIIDEGIQAANLNASVTNQPIRKLRFFREFFGYPKASDVFKDDARFGAGRHEAAVSRLIDEADLWVEHILENDEHVFEQLLTSDEFYVFHNGDNDDMQRASTKLKRVYDRFKDEDWKNLQAGDLAPHMDFLRTIFEF